MRIGVVAPPYLTVPPQAYGGIELVVAHLADGLVARGHDVTLFASGGSSTDARLVSPLADAPGEASLSDPFYAFAHVLEAYESERDFDVLHDHTVHGTALAAMSRTPRVVHTLHGPWTGAARRYYRRLGDRVRLVAISDTQRAANPEAEYAAVVPNGVDLSSHPYREDHDGYLVFVGRVNREKGPEHAVEVARRAGLPLVMVVKRAEDFERRHWETHVAPRLRGDETVLDNLPHDEVLDLVAGARAMVFPIQWQEPFGLVMAEAMATGTPVVTRPLGAARELVRHGETGFLCDSVDDMVAAVHRVGTLSPAMCRAHVAKHYSSGAMVEGYERLYRRVVASDASSRAPSRMRCTSVTTAP